MKTQKKILRFHTGRGGRFHNQGYVTFVDFEKMTSQSPVFDDLFYYEEENKIIDNGSNVLDFVMNDDGTGYIDDDGEYNTDTWVFEDDLNTKQIHAIIREFDGFYGDELKTIINEFYPEYL